MVSGLLFLFAVVGVPCVISAIVEPRLSEEQADKLVHIFTGEKGDT